MSASLVGSEMCIRDSSHADGKGLRGLRIGGLRTGICVFAVSRPLIPSIPVSYTHLTLPTICSV
eukprot:109097-Alexandrium_andersonii.AAC.1